MNDATALEKTVEALNDCIKGFLWMDFEIVECHSNKLVVIGSIDPSDSHDVEIEFGDIAFVSSPMSWQTDTSKVVVTLVTGERASELNQRFGVEAGYHVLRFSPEDRPSEFGCYVGARHVAFKRCPRPPHHACPIPNS